MSKKDDFLVKNLPRIQALDFKQYAGYLTVNEESNGRLFFWLFESAGDPANDPLIVWLNGGPGCSSTSGLFFENGPFHFDLDTGELVPNEYSWNKHANMLYIDQPVGVGMSYTDDDGYVTHESQVDQEFYTFLQEFYNVFPAFKSNPFFISGESYAGHYIPCMAYHILQQNKNSTNFHIPLEGVMIGNGWMAPEIQTKSFIDFAYGSGIIGEEQKKQFEERFKDVEREFRMGLENSPGNICNQILGNILDVSGTADYHVNCYDIREYYYGDDILTVWPKGLDLIKAYLNRDDVREAIHAEHDPVKTWTECNITVGNKLRGDHNKAVMDKMTMILSEIRVLVYNGQFDMICNHVGASRALYDLKWPGQGGFQNAQRYTWVVDGKPAGYATSFDNLTFLLVLGGSHMVPMDVPAQALDMVTRFPRHKDFNDYLQGSD